MQKTNKEIAENILKQVGKLTSTEHGKTMTSICCMSSFKNSIPPLLIFPNKQINPLFINDAPSEGKGYISTSRWSADYTFVELLMHFQKTTNLSPDNQFIFILNYHAS